MRTIAVVLVAASASVVFAQDAQWMRSWEDAQKHRPATIASSSRIAATDEPGTPLVVHGRVVKGDGTTPAEGVIVFAYHTDRNGLYAPRGEHGWRLRGWARTGRDGRFAFQTIRPAPYPGSRIPAHIHLTIEGPGVPRQWTPDVQFADDPFLTAADRAKSKAAGIFGAIRTVATRDSVQHVDCNLRITGNGRF